MDEEYLILVVEDNEMISEPLILLLELLGYKVDWAQNGRIALEKIHEQGYDLILLDIMMPEMNGYDVLRYLKNNPELRHIPVVMLSALDDIKSVVQCIQLGADDYLFKPFDRTLLKARIKASLDRKRWHDQEQAYVATLETDIKRLRDSKLGDFSAQNLVLIPDNVFRQIELRVLRLNDNQITNLSRKVGQLTNLEELNLKSNNLISLPHELKQLTNLKILDLRDNPLPIPPEILAQYDNPAAILNYYFQQEEANIANIFSEAKMLVVGQAGVGKTSLVKRLIDEHFDIHEGKTIGIDIKKWFVTIDNYQVCLNVWDFGGQEIYHSTHQFFLTNRSVYLLVIDARQGEEVSRLEYWLKHVRSFGGDSPIIVVVNKIDQHSLDLDTRRLQLKYPSIHAFISTSCFTGDGIAELYKAIQESVSGLNHIHERWLPSWFAVRQKLENMKSDFIPYDDYLRMCLEEDIYQELEQRTLIRYLHDLGIILNFQDDPRLEDTNVLNPEWVTQGVYQILNAELLAKKKGLLDVKLLNQILDQEAYPRRKHPFIIDMMEKFQLCYRFAGEPDRYLIPGLFQKEEPIIDWDSNDNLSFEFHYDNLLQSIFSRFIVYMHNYIDGQIYWRSGVMLRYEGNQAIVKADWEDKKIYISVRGNNRTRRNLLSIIRAQFKLIHKTIPYLEVSEVVAIPSHPGEKITYRELLNLEEKGIKSYFYAKIDDEINVSELLNGIEEPEARNLSKLREKIQKSFNISDIRDLCLDLEIDYDNLAGHQKQDKIRELLLYLERSGRISELLKICRQYRPRVF